VVDSDDLRNSILRNSIFSNGGLGIDLLPGGVTDNDIGMMGPHDTDAGPNGLQNFPVIEELGPAAGRVEFTLMSAPNTRFLVEVFVSDDDDPTGFGEGQRFRGAKVVRTNSSGSVQAVFHEKNPSVGFVALTATRLGAGDDPRDTSEFADAEVAQ
jgi:hypothetical protein